MPDETNSRTSKNALVLLLGTVTRMAVTFGFILYAAPLLGPEGFGKYALAVHYFELFLALAAAPTALLLTREIAARPAHRDELISSALVLSFAASGLAVALLWLICSVAGYSAEATLSIRIAALALVPGVLSAVLEGVFVARERAEFVALGTAVEVLLRIPLSAAALYWGGGLVAVMWVLVGARLLLVVFYWVCLRRVARLRWRLRARRLRRFLARWWLFAAETSLGTLYTNVDLVILSFFASEHAVGIYSVAARVVRLASFPARSYTTAVYPVLARAHREGSGLVQQVRLGSIRYLLVVALGAIVVVTANAERVIGWLFEDGYLDAISVLQILIWTIVFEFLNPFLSHSLFAEGRQRQSTISAAVGLLVNLSATIWLVQKWGAWGAAAGTVLGGAAALCCYVAFSCEAQERRELRFICFRIAAAAAGLSGVFFALRRGPWPLVIAIALLTYAALLWLLRAMDRNDLKLMRSWLRYRRNP